MIANLLYYTDKLCNNQTNYEIVCWLFFSIAMEKSESAVMQEDKTSRGEARVVSWARQTN